VEDCRWSDEAPEGLFCLCRCLPITWLIQYLAACGQFLVKTLIATALKLCKLARPSPPPNQFQTPTSIPLHASDHGAGRNRRFEKTPIPLSLTKTTSKAMHGLPACELTIEGTGITTIETLLWTGGCFHWRSIKLE
jgi:hypothetical protein